MKTVKMKAFRVLGPRVLVSRVLVFRVSRFLSHLFLIGVKSIGAYTGFWGLRGGCWIYSLECLLHYSPTSSVQLFSWAYIGFHLNLGEGKLFFATIYANQLHKSAPRS